MKKVTFIATLITLLISSPLIADTIELADGSLLEGDFVGSSNGIIMFDTGDGIEAFPEDQVVGIFLSEGVSTAEALAAVAAPAGATVPAGTRLVIRTTETIDSNQHGAGHRFRGQLEGALVVGGVTAVPRGTFVHGRAIQSSSSRRASGSSDLAIEFTDFLLDDQLIPIRTTGLQAQGANEAGRTVGRTARAAAIGGLIGGSSGARTGAKVGVGASILTSGSSINIPRGTMLEMHLDAPLTVDP